VPTHMTIPRLAPGLVCETLDQAARVELNCRALLRQGFIYVRTVVLPHPSGALFQRPTQQVVYDATARAEAARNR